MLKTSVSLDTHQITSLMSLITHRRREILEHKAKYSGSEECNWFDWELSQIESSYDSLDTALFSEPVVEGCD